MEHALLPYKSKYFYNDLTTSLRDLFTKSNYSDVTLVSDDQIQFQAHKFVLSACSSVMESLLLNNPHPHPLIYLKGVKQQELGSILELMYCGQAMVNKDRINYIFDKANELQIKHLTYSDVKEETFDIKVDEIANNDNVTVDDYVGNSFNPADCSDADIKSKEVKNIPASDVPITGGENYLHKCDKCEAGFRWKNGLVRHVRSQHEGVRYSCNNCEYQAPTQWDLKRHNNSIHEGIKYFCDQCEFHATYQNSLRIHKESIHEGVKYSCDQCEYQATRRVNLKTHKLTQHEGVTYSCNQCAYQTTKQHNLKTHNQLRHEVSVTT